MTYFITACAHMHRNLFQRDEVSKLMVSTLLNYRDAGEYDLHEYVVMPNHIHVLVSLPDGKPLSRVIQLIKGGFSHTLREHGIVFPTVWQQRYHDRRVRDENEFAEIAEYIRQNPVRKGLVQRAEEYPYSSAHMGARGSGLKPLTDEMGTLDANLKVRSTDPSQHTDAWGRNGLGLRPLSTKEQALDAGLKASSTKPSSALVANLKAHRADPSQVLEAELSMVRCTC